jgi:hypothetical protein
MVCLTVGLTMRNKSEEKARVIKLAKNKQNIAVVMNDISK